VDTNYLDPIGSAFITVIGYKQTNRQTPRQAKLTMSVDGK